MDVSNSWTAHDWMNRGGELLDPDPWLAHRLLARGLQLDPTEALAWFNRGIGLHQQRRIAAAVRAYRHCLALPHSKDIEQALATTWRRTYSCLATGRRDGITMPSVFPANRETTPFLNGSSDPATEDHSSQGGRCCS